MSHNKAGYTTQDAPNTRLETTGDGPTDGRADGLTDTTSYRDATAHLKRMVSARAYKRPGERERESERERERIAIFLLIFFIFFLFRLIFFHSLSFMYIHY